MSGNSQGFYWMIADLVDPKDKGLADFLNWVRNGGNSLLEVFQSSEYVTTGERRKLLAVHKGYLIWFEVWSDPLSSPNRSSSNRRDESRISQDESANINVRGFCSVKGTFVESSEGSLAKSNHFLAPSYSNMQKALASYRNHSADGDVKTKEANVGEHFLKIWKHKGSKICETLYFESRTKYEEWRVKLGSSVVFFGDLDSRYKITNENGSPRNLGHLNDCKLKVRIENVKNKESLMGWRYPVVDIKDKKTVNAQAIDLLKECAMMVKLKPAAILPEFRELCFTEHCFVLIHEQSDAVPFSEWFSNTWCPEYGDHKDPGPVLSLMIDLTALVVSLSMQRIVHGNICKDIVLVKPICKTPSSRSPSPKSVTRGTRPMRGAAMGQSEYLRRLNLQKKPARSDSSLVQTLEGSVEPQSIMKSRTRIGYKLLLSDMNGAVDCKADKSAGQPARTEGSGTTFDIDVKSLGILLTEVFHMARSIVPDEDLMQLSPPFGRQIDQQYRHPVTSQVLSLLKRMTDPSGPTPSIKECYDCLVVARATVAKEAKASNISVAPSRLSVETLKSAFATDFSARIVSFTQTASNMTSEMFGPSELGRKVSFNTRGAWAPQAFSEARDASELTTTPRAGGFVRPSLTLRLPSTRVLCYSTNAFTKDSSWNLRNASTIDNRTSNCEGSDLQAIGSQNSKLTARDGAESTLRHYRSYSATPRVCLSGRELFAKENKPKQVVPGTGESVQTITSGSKSNLRLKPEAGKYSLMANKKPGLNKNNEFFSFRAIGRKSSCPVSDIRVEEPNFAHSGESSNQSSSRTMRMRPALGWPAPLLKCRDEIGAKRDH